jgi:23S rRNA (guanosine2251-2'-O)-methyltransferase
VKESDIRSLAGSAHHQGVAARAGPFPYETLESILSRDPKGSQILVMLDSVQDPNNVGSILRSAECLGAVGVVIAKDRAAGITPAVEKASAGASAHLAIARVVNLVRAIEQVKQESFWVYGADASATDTCYQVDLKGNVAFVLGSEEAGLRRLVRESCDCCVRIPMAGRIDSLNVAQTAAILLAESMRQRKHAV